MDGYLDDDTDPGGRGEWKRLRPGGPLEWVPAPAAARVHVADVALGVLERIASAQQRSRIPVFVGSLCECGCAVAPGETCPACLVWAQKDAARHSWRSPIMKEKVWA